LHFFNQKNYFKKIMGYFIKSNQGFIGNSEELARTAMIAANGLFLPGDHDKINERLVRYYVTEGLVTRPTRIGRDAEYGYLQLLQFLGSRFLVEQGYPLAKVAPYIQALSNDQLEDMLMNKHKPSLAELLVAGYKNPPSRSRSAVHSIEKSVIRPKRSLKDFLDDENEEPFIQNQKSLIISKMENQGHKAIDDFSSGQLTSIESSIQEINHKLMQIKDQMKHQQMDVQFAIRQLQGAIEEFSNFINKSLQISQEGSIKLLNELAKKERRQAQELSLLDERIKLIEQDSLQKNTQRGAGDKT
jgi:DNA-binding transcriptional MerR regulator